MSVIAKSALPWACILLLPLALTQAVLGQSGTKADPELIVRVSDTASSSFADRIQASTSLQSTDSLMAGVEASQAVFPRSSKTAHEATRIPAFTLTFQDSSAFNAVKSRLRKHPEVRYVHPNAEYTMDRASPMSFGGVTPDSVLSGNTFADSLDHLSIIRALSAWKETTGKETVSVGVVDTGIYFDHPDLAGQFWTNPEESRNAADGDGNGFVDDVHGYDFVDQPSVTAEGEYQDRDADPSPDSLGSFAGHGTSVAGVVSAQAADAEAGMMGVAPKTQIVALRAFGGGGVGQTDDIASAIMYAAQEDIDVLNLSFGRDRATPLLREAIEFAISKGTIVVASAGNDGAVDEPHYPSDYPPVISVLWLAEDGEGVPDFSRSQYGIGVDLGAPGSGVFTTQYPRRRIVDGQPIRQEDLYGPAFGSSFSAPQIAGAAALLRSVDSTLSPASVQSILTGTADDIGRAGWDHVNGAGRVNVARGLMRSYPARTEIRSPTHNEGFTGAAPIPVVGTALDPALQSYSVFVAEATRNLDRRPDPWIQIAGPVETRALRDTLAIWDVPATDTLEDGAFTLRLVTTLRDGRTIEDRRRVVLDSTPPEALVQFVGAGRVGDHVGILADVATDDTVRSQMEIRIRGRTAVRNGEYVTPRQGLTWADKSGLGGEASVEITLTNRSGLTTTIDRSVSVPANTANPSFFQAHETDVPGGTVLPRAPDFDRDQLPELVFNQFQTRRGGLSDTLRAFEWATDGFAPSDTLITNLIPKDVGDTNKDGQREMLFQIDGVTLLLEQRRDDVLPTRIVFADTSARTDSPDGPSTPSLHGARLTDLDQDGKGEIVGNWRASGRRTEWRVLERQDNSFELRQRLDNPTTHGRRDTARSAPNAATGDFDGDEQRDLLVGDQAGNWIVYEAAGDGSLEVAWTYETDRFAASDRFAVGDVTGDDQPEFVTHNTYTASPPDGGDPEPPISYYQVWSAAGDDTYERIYRLPVAGERSLGDMTAADFDGDDRDEIAIVHPPSVFVVGTSESGKVRVLHQNRRRPSVRTRAVVAADFNGNGHPSLLAATTGATMRRYVTDFSSVENPPPRWVRAVPTGPGGSRLSWRAPGADSVTVFAGSPGAALDPVVSTSDSSVTIADSSRLQFSLRAWTNGESSPLSPKRLLRPHDSATVASVNHPDPSSIRLTFSEPIHLPRHPEQFSFGTYGAPETVLRANNGQGLVLRYTDEVTSERGTLTWTGLRDTTGLPVAQQSATVSFPSVPDRSLFVKDVAVLDEQRVRLTFSAPLEPSRAQNEDNYAVRPQGTVEHVGLESTPPTTVTLGLDGIIAGASGYEASLKVSSLRSESGASLSEEGATIRLTQPADGLAGVKLYPNPIELSRHDPTLTVAGLPRDAVIRIYNPAGRLVERLSVDGTRDGGTTWDLRTRRGDRVPSGIYLVRVQAPDASPVTKKAAVIR